MFCSKCGNQIADGTTICPNCGNTVAPGAAANVAVQQINTWLIPAILVTVFCCLPLGIVSIVYAAGANSEVSNRNFVLAQEKADKAKMWFWLAFGCGIVANILAIILQVVFTAAAAAASAAD